MTRRLLTFNAIDVETANSDSGSICQIGIVHVVDAAIADTLSTLVDPEGPFDRYNVRVHGISRKKVTGSPSIPDLREELCSRLACSYLVSHTAFDRGAMDRAMDRYGFRPLQATWLDSARIAKVAWPRLRSRSLPTLAKKLRIEFRHHDAAEDAMVAARLVIEASRLLTRSMCKWGDQLG